MHRRRFLHAATLAGAALPLASVETLAQARDVGPSTPIPAGESGLVARVVSIDPETLLEALLTMPVTTPLLPSDTPPVEPVPWEDESDSDLAGAVGGVLFQTGFDTNDNPLVVATAIVHPDAESATAVLAEVGPRDMRELLGMPFFVEDFGDYAVSVVRVGYLLLAGGAEAPEDDPPVVYDTAATGATPASQSERAPRLDLRAMSYLTALLDHLDGVLATLDA
jgi:hypothetical protein